MVPARDQSYLAVSEAQTKLPQYGLILVTIVQNRFRIGSAEKWLIRPPVA